MRRMRDGVWCRRIVDDAHNEGTIRIQAIFPKKIVVQSFRSRGANECW